MTNRNKRWYEKHRKTYAAKYRNTKPEIKKKVAKRYYENNKEVMKASARRNYIKRRKENPELLMRKAKDLHLKRTYGINIEEYDKMLFSQHGLCKICYSMSCANPYLHVDHCHKTDRIRGLICITCNTVIGHYEKYKLQIEEYLK